MIDADKIGFTKAAVFGGDDCGLGWLMMVALHPLVEIDSCSLGSWIMVHYIYIVVEVDGCESRVPGDVVVSSRWSDGCRPSWLTMILVLFHITVEAAESR